MLIIKEGTMLIIEEGTRQVRQMSWGNLKAAVDAHIPEIAIHSGDTIFFNLKDGRDVTVKVAKNENGDYFFVLENCLELRHVNWLRSTKVIWDACGIRNYLNEEFFYKLPDDLQSVIATTVNVQIVDGKRVESEDKLFLLSATQVFGKGEYSKLEPEDTQLDCFNSEKSRLKEYRGETIEWWLRTMDESSVYKVCLYAPFAKTDPYYNHGVVFAFKL